MKFYIATRLASRAQRVARLLEQLFGDALSYDWTEHGSVQDDGAERIAQVAAAECNGVKGADYVVVLLPGGRGTHVELGIAVGCSRPTFVFAGQHAAHLGEDERTCAFYHAPGVTLVEGDNGDLLAAIGRWRRTVGAPRAVVGAR